jgi:hypothetical protein
VAEGLNEPVTGRQAGAGHRCFGGDRRCNRRGPESDPSRKLGGGIPRGAGNTETKGDNTITERRPKIAALVADAFQEEEYFFPKVALNEAGYQVEVVSSRKQPVEISCWSTVQHP